MLLTFHTCPRVCFETLVICALCAVNFEIVCPWLPLPMLVEDIVLCACACVYVTTKLLNYLKI